MFVYLRKITLPLFSAFMVVCLASCVTAPRKKDDSDKQAKQADDKVQEGNIDESYVSSQLKLSVTSLSNSRLTSKTVDRTRAEQYARKAEESLKGKETKDSRMLLSIMSAKRLAGMDLNEVLETARKLIAVEMSKKVDRELPEFAKLEIVLASIRSKKLGLAEYFIADLLDSKNKQVKAAAYTAEGIVNVYDDRLPEAVASWGKALKEVPDYPAAALNHGFVSLKYGDFENAKKLLASLQEDWFAASGLLVAERMTDNLSRADSLCSRVLSQNPDHRPTLYNCALHEYQGKNNPEKALELLTKMTRNKGQSGEWEEKAFSLMTKIEGDRTAASKKAKKEETKAAPEPKK